MRSGLSTQVDNVAPSFNVHATFTKPLQDSAPGSVHKSLEESSTTKGLIDQQLQQISTQQAVEKNDGGAINNSSGTVSKIAQMAGGAVLTSMVAVVSPVTAAYIGAGMAVGQGFGFARSGLPEYEGKSSFNDFVSKGKNNGLSAYEQSMLETYTCATGEICDNGWVRQSQQNPVGVAARSIMSFNLDQQQETGLDQIASTLRRKREEHVEQADEGIVFARDRNIGIKDFAGGPTPPIPGTAIMPKAQPSFG